MPLRVNVTTGYHGDAAFSRSQLFGVLVLGGFAAVFALVWEDKSTEVVAPFVTLAAGVLGGLLAPSP
jgi:hypothetical protein